MAVSGAEIKGGSSAALDQIRQRADMRLGEVRHMNVVAHSGAVRGRIIGAVDMHRGRALQRRTALMAGADLGGARGVLLMQSSGAGNCINMLSLIKCGDFPFFLLVLVLGRLARGDCGEGNPWQYPRGKAVEPVLSAMGVICLRIETPEEVIPTVSAAHAEQ